MATEQLRIPKATAKRLPLYYRFLQNLYQSGKLRVSSAELSEAVKVDSATIRRDFSYFGALGKKGYGYNVQYLLNFFRKTLDQDALTKVALIGVGNLGTALLRYNFTKNNNTKICYAFDTNESKIGTQISDVTVYSLDQLEEILNKEEIQVVILTVPAQAAQSVTDRLVKTRVKGILNFTPARLNVPSSINVHHIDLAVELQSFVYFIKNYSNESEDTEEVEENEKTRI
ncbi:redox-sensing transcriptional repressor Rex [Caldibacillus thermolactis]|jgi:redox-sensing transcriptional repressor|uniref:Redox-sensing transcriptional repressor Rex n=1 Tax=Pallidibacillus thermolactis TaxID=251051 RepID=A0ABT2WJL7_9BACI|nr:redox-sensing transcriptional repressor Rex [Pallidibacillus thermolactis]MCU9595602.1 redox-sensing transcriptional repressor Rex [Pallidibacillus thermolactis]